MARHSKRHIHKYHKIDVNYTDVWACALPDCTHFMPKHMENMVLGRASLCWQCNERFILNTENMKNKRPICPTCALGVKEDELELPLSDAMKARIAGK